MGQSISNLLTHIIFSTKERKPLILEEVEIRLHSYIKTLCTDCESPIIQIGGVSDHLHLLLCVSRKISVSQLVNEIKSHSSKWMKSIEGIREDFGWQSGFGAFSVGQMEYHKVISYISNQKEHHKTVTFQEEYLKFLQQYGMPFDEKYLWT